MRIRVRLLPLLLSAVGLSAATLLGGCAGAPQAEESGGTPQDFIFYPALPDEPRLQYLTKLSSALDVSSESQAMRAFVFGGDENEGHLVTKPYGVAIFEGAVYVPDLRGNGYAVFDLAGGGSRFVRPSGSGALKKPGNIAIDTDGTRYVTDTDLEKVKAYDRNDRFLRAYGKTGQFNPGDVCIVGDRLYISDLLHSSIQVLDKRTGEFLFAFGEKGNGPGQFLHAANLALGPDDTLWVSDQGNFRVQRFSLDGEFIAEIGAVGTSPGHFARPKGIAVDRENHVYVVDAAFPNIQILDEDGRPLLFFGESGSGPGNINLPAAVKIDYDNIQYFQKYAHPDFEIEYIVLVASQFGLNKVNVYGFGSLDQ